MFHSASRVALIVGFIAFFTFPAFAIDGEVLITQAKANAGNVTPGDAPGFPVTLSRPGSYKFAGNLTVPLDKDGIQVAANDVTIDLAGFRMHGQGNGFIGINGGNWASLTVRNGTIALFKAHGINGLGPYWIIDNMRITHNLGRGVSLGSMSSVLHSNVTSNGETGIVCSACHVEGNLVSNNGNHGIFIIGGGTVLGNTIIGNKFAGISAFEKPAGYGNNTLADNNQSGAQVAGQLRPLHPNVCSPSCN